MRTRFRDNPLCRTRRMAFVAILTTLVVLALLIVGRVGPFAGVLGWPRDTPVGQGAPDAGHFAGQLPNGESARIFAPDSFWYRPLPDDTPVVPHSDAVVARITSVARESLRDDPYPHPSTLPQNPPLVTVNTQAYSPGVFVANESDPIGNFSWDNCGGLPEDVGRRLVEDHLQDIHVPLSAQPAQGSDHEMAIYNVDTRQLTELWRVTKQGPTHFSACWGGTIVDASTSSGMFPGSFGATATGLSLVGGIITPNELKAGRIDHVVGVIVDVSVLNDQVSWPARRTDGRALGEHTIAAGQMLRLPASLDLDAMRLSPASRTIAQAAQRYGLIVWDGGAPFTFRAVNPNSLAWDPYPALIGDEGYGLMGNTARGEEPFPVDRLQVLSMLTASPDRRAG